MFLRERLRCLWGFSAFLVHILRVAYAVNDVLHVFYGDGLNTRVFQVGKYFRHTVFYVIGYLCPTLASGKILFHVLQVLLQQGIRVLVYGIQLPEEVNGVFFFIV